MFTILFQLYTLFKFSDFKLFCRRWIFKMVWVQSLVQFLEI
jgi:hypothetical protein